MANVHVYENINNPLVGKLTPELLKEDDGWLHITLLPSTGVNAVLERIERLAIKHGWFGDCTASFTGLRTVGELIHTEYKHHVGCVSVYFDPEKKTLTPQFTFDLEPSTLPGYIVKTYMGVNACVYNSFYLRLCKNNKFGAVKVESNDLTGYMQLIDECMEMACTGRNVKKHRSLAGYNSLDGYTEVR